MKCYYCFEQYRVLNHLDDQEDMFVCSNCGCAFKLEYIGWFTDDDSQFIEDGSYPTKENIRRT